MLQEEIVKISIIIPVYNMETYIGKCLDSIFEQTLKEIEIICIDDGSTDHTENVIHSYQNRYTNIRFKKQTNQGAGPARNLGITYAEGKYIAFMDADDFYPNSCSLEYLYDAAERSKVMICGGSRSLCHENIETLCGVRKELVFQKDGIIKTKDFEGMCGYQQFLYRRDFITQYQVEFPNYRRCQDLPFFIKALSLVDEIYVCKICSYCYRKEHKIVIFDEKKATDYLKGMRDALKITLEHDMRLMYTNIMNDFFEQPSAILYHYVANGSCAMIQISREIRRYLVPEKIVKEKYRNRRVQLLEEEKICEYIVQVKNKWNGFFCQADKKILIFGAGTVGRNIYRIFKRNGVNVVAFVVSDTAQNVREIDGIPVRNIDDYYSSREQYMVVMAVYGYLQEEVDQLLKRKGIEKRIRIAMEELYLCADEITH